MSSNSWIFSKFSFRAGGGGPDTGEHDRRLPRYYMDHTQKGPFMQEDRSGNPHGGGLQYKGFDSKGKRMGTFDEKGNFLRK